MKKAVLLFLCMMLAGCGASTEASPSASASAASATTPSASAETQYLEFAPDGYDNREVTVLIPSTWRVVKNELAYMDLCFGTFTVVSSKEDAGDGLELDTFQAIVETIAQTASKQASIDYFRYQVLDDAMGNHPYGMASYSFTSNNAPWLGYIYVVDLNNGYIVLNFKALKGADYTNECEQEADLILSHLQFQEQYHGDGQQYVKMYEEFIKQNASESEN